jgi:AcrR family transcriptional regulator
MRAPGAIVSALTVTAEMASSENRDGLPAPYRADPRLPRNIRLGRHGRIGILKKVPRDLWSHPRYRDKAKVIERSTGTADPAAGVEMARALLAALEREFAAARADMRRHPEAPARARPAAGPARPRTQVGEQTRQEILAAGMREFSEKGLRGARIDAIAAQTQTTKPMIYYHFGSKQKLYAAVMEAAYAGMRSLEQALHLEDLPPDEAIRRLVGGTFDHRAAHPEWVRLITVENMERASHISGRASIAQVNAAALSTLQDILDRGARAGLFHPALDAWQVHLLLTSLCFYRVSNRYTWLAIFGLDLWEKESTARQRQMAIDTVLNYVRRDGAR